MKISLLQKGCFWEVIGQLLFFGCWMVVELAFGCDPWENCDKIYHGTTYLLIFFTPLFGFLVGLGLYGVGATHIGISQAPWLYKLSAIILPLFIPWLVVLIVNHNF